MLIYALKCTKRLCLISLSFFLIVLSITISESTSDMDQAEVAKEEDEVPADVVQLCRETFKKTAEYLHGELEGTIEDYKLLENMNRITINKYTEMKSTADSIAVNLQTLNDKYKQLQPFLDQIDQIEESVSTLEQAAYKLDNYSKRLEARFRNLEKR